MSGAVNAVVAMIGAVVVVRAAVSGHISTGDTFLFLAAVATVQGSFSSVIPQFGRTATSLGLFSSYLDIVDLPVEVTDGWRGVPKLTTGIEVRDLWFRYSETGPWVLRGVSFAIPAGSNIGLVGVNGAGKSTLVKLLLRLYEPVKGAITWDGIDWSELRSAELRGRVRVTFQDFAMYDLAASENIGIGDVCHLDSRDRIRAAAALAQVDETVSRLPAGYDTMLSRVFTDDLGQSGTQLSGGQWQRVAIARALMQTDVDLLILDEPSAGLDAEVEYEIHQTLRAKRNCAKLLISHRLNAIRGADIILVLREGTIIERGTHDQLLELSGEYARLFKLQAAGYQYPHVSVS